MRKTRVLTLGALALASVVACSSSPPSPTQSTVSPTQSTVSPTGTATATASAEGALVKFIDAARAVDSRLRYAADLINGAIRSDTIVVDARTVAAVKATDASAVAAAIPAGMPPKLMLPVLIVYSDLVSRSASMRHFDHAETYPRLPSADQGPSQYSFLLRDLANGSPAAHRFAADLAAVVKSARSTPPLMAVGPTSLASAEVAVRREFIRKSNAGCDIAGGHVATTLASIIWDDAAPTATTRTGFIADKFAPAGEGVKFTATYARGDGWTADIWAC